MNQLSTLSVLQVLQDFPSSTANLPFQYMIDLIPMLQPRAFSIASSMQVNSAYTPLTPHTHTHTQAHTYHTHTHIHPQAHPGEIQILMAVVKYKTKLHKPRMVRVNRHIFIFIENTAILHILWIVKIETSPHRVCVPLGCLHWTHWLKLLVYPCGWSLVR